MQVSCPRPDVIFTHESDLDGLVCGCAAATAGRKMFEHRRPPGGLPLSISGSSATCARNPPGSPTSPSNRAWTGRTGRSLTITPPIPPPRTPLFIHDITKSAGLLCYELCQQHGLGSPALDRLVHLNNVADLFLEDDPDFIARQRLRESGEDLPVLESARAASTARSKNCWTIRCSKSWRSSGASKIRSASSGARKTSPKSRPHGRLRRNRHRQQQSHRPSIAGTGRRRISRAGHAVPAGQQHGHRQLPQPQRRGAQDRGKLKAAAMPTPAAPRCPDP